MKVWLRTLVVDYSFGFKPSEERIILKIIRNNQKRFISEWVKFYE